MRILRTKVAPSVCSYSRDAGQLYSRAFQINDLWCVQSAGRFSLKYFKWSGWPINLNGTREGFSVDTIECSVGPNWDLDTRGERE